MQKMQEHFSARCKHAVEAGEVDSRLGHQCAHARQMYVQIQGRTGALNESDCPGAGRGMREASLLNQPELKKLVAVT